jgi:hypothetical protein
MTVKLPPPPESAPSPSTAAADKAGAGNWHVYTCDGQRYGPITKDDLDRWATEKRLTQSCQVYQDGWPTWRMASELYSDLPAAAAGMVAGAGAAPNVPGSFAASSNPYAAPAFAGAGGAVVYQIPHRGSLILVLGILGLVLCGCFTALPAWIMGHADLQKMKAGQMDNSGYGMTMAGMVLGIIYCVLWLLVVVLWIVIFGILGAAGAGANRF